MDRRRFLRAAPLALSACAGITTSFVTSPTTAAALAGVVRSAPAAPRVVVLDWGLTETLLAMGITPVGVAEVAAYNAAVVAPLLSPGVPDVGLRLAPSLEWLQALSPDLILINSSQASQRAMLERIAPVHDFAVYTDAGAPLQHSQTVTRALGALCRQADAAEALIADTDATLRACRQRLQTFAQTHDLLARALYIVQFFDARHLGLYGARSLFQDVMTALDVPNAWQGATDYWGIGVGGLDALTATPDAGLLYFEPLPAAAQRMMQGNRLWQALPAPHAGRVAPLAPFWGFGMLPSAGRFARVLTDRLCDNATVGWRHA